MWKQRCRWVSAKFYGNISQLVSLDYESRMTKMGRKLGLMPGLLSAADEGKVRRMRLMDQWPREGQMCRCVDA